MVYDYEEDIWNWEKQHGKKKYADSIVQRTGFKRNEITEEDEKQNEE